jgi:hypothetical protein
MVCPGTNVGLVDAPDPKPAPEFEIVPYAPGITMFGFTRMFPAGELVDTGLILLQLP